MAARKPVAPPGFGQARDSIPGWRTLLQAPVRWPQPQRLEAPISNLPGIGPALSGRAAETGVETVTDLLWRVPRALDAPPGTRLIEELEPGEVTILAVEIERSRRVRTRKRGLSVIEARVADSSGAVKATWFNQPWLAERLMPGSRFLLEGRLGPKGFTVSASEPLGGAVTVGPAGGSIRWDRPDTELPSQLSSDAPRVSRPGGAEIGPARWRRWVFEACRLAALAADPVPAELLTARGLPVSAAAFREIHFPENEERAGLALKRLAWEELLLYRAAIENRRRRERDASGPAVPLDGPDRVGTAWLERLPFNLTEDQARAIAGIRVELAGTAPMRRLLMGEVGSGKTVVALAAALRAAESDAQTALMAPTGVLAEQHAGSIDRLLDGTGVRVGLLTGATTGSARKMVLDAAAGGELDLLVGTHALLEPEVRFRRLALAIVDEEHRFGVRQRARLEAKASSGESAHLLHLSATPIPRTLSLTLYGDLDVTTLRELPSGRGPVRTELARETDRTSVFARVRDELDRGRQAFVVCSLIEESEELEARAAASEAERLAEAELAGYEVGLVHGRMKPGEKQRAMAAFADGRTRILVSTTVIEVGIDVPNATVMVIEGAERFGLSQIHQLRGRIGRGEHGGTCFLLPGGGGAMARRRLAELTRESDGFRLAELDLEMRGEGEITGTRQHGVPRFRAASLPRDGELLEAACGDLARLGEGPDAELLAAAGEARFGRVGRSDRSGGEGTER